MIYLPPSGLGGSGEGLIPFFRDPCSNVSQAAPLSASLPIFWSSPGLIQGEPLAELEGFGGWPRAHDAVLFAAGAQPSPVFTEQCLQWGHYALACSIEGSFEL